MLRFLSQRSKTQKAILWVFVGLLVVGLAVVFVAPNDESFLGDFAPAPTDATVIAEIGKYDVTLGDLRGQIRSMGRNQQQQNRPTRPEDVDTEALYPTYGRQAIDSLVNQRVVRLEGDRLGLGATQDEMRERILGMFSPGGRWIGADAYQRHLRDQGITVQGFESDIATSIVEEKLRNFLTSAVTVSDKELEEDYRRTGTTMNASWVVVAPKTDVAALPATDEELLAYFNAHKDEFKITQPQRKVTYLFVDQAAVGRTLPVTDEELQAEYSGLSPDKTVTAVHLAEIVFKIPDKSKDAEVRDKAQKVADRAKGGPDKPAEDFAELARTMSERPETATRGGDAGWLEKAAVKPDDPRMRAFSMKDGEVSAPFKLAEHYVVYKALERRTKGLEEMRDELGTAVRTRRGYTRAVEIADEVEKRLRASKDPAAVAQEVNAANSAPADAPIVSVRETGYLQPGDSDPTAGAQLSSAAADLKETGDIGAKVGVTGGFAVPMLADKRDPHDAAFEEVKDRVAIAFRQEKAKLEARATAEQLAASASPDELKTRASAAGLEAKSQETYTAGGALPGLVASDLIDNQLLNMPVGSVSKTPVELPIGFVVVGLADRKEPDMGDSFAKQKDSIRERILSTKRSQLYASYMENRVKQLKESKEIVIHQDTIDRAFALSGFGDENDPAIPSLPPVGAPQPSTGAAPGRPQMPPGMPGGAQPGMPGGAPKPMPPPSPAPPSKP